MLIRNRLRVKLILASANDGGEKDIPQCARKAKAGSAKMRASYKVHLPFSPEPALYVIGGCFVHLNLLLFRWFIKPLTEN